MPGVKASNCENSRRFVDSSTSLVRAEEVEAAVGVFPGRGVVAVEVGARQRRPGAVQRGGQVHVAAFFAIFVEKLTTCSVKYCLHLYCCQSGHSRGPRGLAAGWCRCLPRPAAPPPPRCAGGPRRRAPAAAARGCETRWAAPCPATCRGRLGDTAVNDSTNSFEDFTHTG